MRCSLDTMVIHENPALQRPAGEIRVPCGAGAVPFSGSLVLSNSHIPSRGRHESHIEQIWGSEDNTIPALEYLTVLALE